MRLRWHTEATDYPNKTYGKARIFKYRCPPKSIYWAEGMRGVLTYQFEPGYNKITELTIGGLCWMTDLPPYYWSMQHFAEQARGRVLVAGLGLGLIVHRLVKNPSVTKITVVEREPDVIGLLTPLLPKDPRIGIIEKDFYQFMPWDKEKRDTVIFDLGLWDEEQVQAGWIETLVIKEWVENKYGKDCLCLRHGIDRDPLGEAFVRTERFKTARRIFTGGR